VSTKPNHFDLHSGTRKLSKDLYNIYGDSILAVLILCWNVLKYSSKSGVVGAVSFLVKAMS
jgi:hypothetical protein